MRFAPVMDPPCLRQTVSHGAPTLVSKIGKLNSAKGAIFKPNLINKILCGILALDLLHEIDLWG